MDFLELAKKRYSVRKYKDTPVEEEKIMRILEAGRVAPTGCNAQPQRIFVLREKESIEKLNQGTRTFGAPLVFVICVEKDLCWVRKYDRKCISDIDAAIVTDHMMLAATDEGLGSCWICYFRPNVVKEVLNLPEGVEPVNILAAGYADEEPLPSDRHDSMNLRKPLDDLVFFEKFE